MVNSQLHRVWPRMQRTDALPRSSSMTWNLLLFLGFTLTGSKHTFAIDLNSKVPAPQISPTDVCHSAFTPGLELLEGLAVTEVNDGYMRAIWNQDPNRTTLKPIYNLGLLATTLAKPDLHHIGIYSSRVAEFERAHKKHFQLTSRKKFQGFTSILRFTHAALSLSSMIEQEKNHTPSRPLKIPDFAHGVALELAIDAVIKALIELNQQLMLCNETPNCASFVSLMDTELRLLVDQNNALQHHTGSLMLNSFFNFAFADSGFPKTDTADHTKSHLSFLSFINGLFYTLDSMQTDISTLTIKTFSKNPDAPNEYLYGASRKLVNLVDTWSQTVYLTHNIWREYSAKKEEKDILVPETPDEFNLLFSQRIIAETTPNLASVVQGFTLLHQNREALTIKQKIELNRIIFRFSAHLSCVLQIKNDVLKGMHVAALARVWSRYLDPFIKKHSSSNSSPGPTGFLTTTSQNDTPTIQEESRVLLEKIRRFFGENDPD